MMDSERHQPEYTVVVAARNDDHGGNLLGRMQIFVSGLLEQCRRHNLLLELIVVEWNPPADAPPLHEVLSWKPLGGPCSARVITVPSDVHRRFPHADGLPLFQMIAKNVGIRRARGKFVLATNVDILFSDELMAFLAAGKVNEGCMYRVDRHDVREAVPVDGTLDEQLEYCRANVIRVHRRHCSLDTVAGRRFPDPSAKDVLGRAYDLLQERGLAPVLRPAPLHINGCGDFTLMARRRWFDVRAYAELELFSMNIDSLLCYAAHHSGIREVILEDPMRIYHIEHGRGSGWTPEGEAAMNARLQKAGVPRLRDRDLREMARLMRRQRRPKIFNGPDWGLDSEDLTEHVVVSPGGPGLGAESSK